MESVCWSMAKLIVAAFFQIQSIRNMTVICMLFTLCVCVLFLLSFSFYIPQRRTRDQCVLVYKCVCL